MTEYLFVYGTLMSTAGHPMGQRLAREARRVSAASIAGRLYDLGKWPGLVDSDSIRDRVHGEVYQIANPASFRWLDAYEGILEAGATPSEYARVVRRIRLENGGEIAAWVYLYQWDIVSARPVPGGRWQTGPVEAVARQH